MPGTAPVKLRAHDAEDLRTLAAFLQDALVPVSDITYLKREKRFVMVVNRFRWESRAAPAPTLAPTPTTESARPEEARDASFEEAGGARPYERVNCGVCFDRVGNVRYLGLDLRHKDQILNLLTVEVRPGAITLIFSDGGAIRLEVRDIRCYLEDLGEPWPTLWRPAHADADAPARESG